MMRTPCSSSSTALLSFCSSNHKDRQTAQSGTPSSVPLFHLFSNSSCIQFSLLMRPFISNTFSFPYLTITLRIIHSLTFHLSFTYSVLHHFFPILLGFFPFLFFFMLQTEYDSRSCLFPFYSH